MLVAWSQAFRRITQINQPLSAHRSLGLLFEAAFFCRCSSLPIYKFNIDSDLVYYGEYSYKRLFDDKMNIVIFFRDIVRIFYQLENI